MSDGPGFWCRATFRLTPDEGSFPRDLLEVSARDSLFSELAQAGDRAGTDATCPHPTRGDLTARNFSFVDLAARYRD
jgi:hypothetical protein